MGIRTVSQTINLQDPGVSVSKYITEINSGNGITVHAINVPEYIQIDSNGMKVFTDNTINPIAEFGSTTYIGKHDGSQSYMRLDFNALRLFEKEGRSYFHISDLREASGQYEMTETFNFNSSYIPETDYVDLQIIANSIESITLNNIDLVEGVDYYTENKEIGVGVFIPHTTIYLQNRILGFGDVLIVTYVSSSRHLKAYTLGIRGTPEPDAITYEAIIGAYSVAEGYRTSAQGQASHGEGLNSHAIGYHSHAEGHKNIARGEASHAEGFNTTTIGQFSHSEGSLTFAYGESSHSEGNRTIASGYGSHAEGYQSLASGDNAHAANTYTIAQRQSQTVIGQYNIADTGGVDETTRGDYAFIIGNGTSDNARSNALAVTWDGNIHMYLDSDASVGTDYNLINSINQLGWTDIIIT